MISSRGDFGVCARGTSDRRPRPSEPGGDRSLSPVEERGARLMTQTTTPDCLPMVMEPTNPRAAGYSIWAFAGAILVGAFLLFQVQPLICKLILPRFGGGPPVWTTCMLFFQSLLFCGYAYSHIAAC